MSMIGPLKSNIEKLRSAYSFVKENKIDLSKASVDKDKAMYDYKEKKKLYYLDAINSGALQLRSAAIQLKSQAFINLLAKFDMYRSNPDEALKVIDQIARLAADIDSDVKPAQKEIKAPGSLRPSTPRQPDIFFEVMNVPQEIKQEVVADIQELEKCYKGGCFRSATMLCGRLLETALHRKYYELTNNDLLEKAPGIGLGKIVAKLQELDVNVDPGLTQQIHLINQMRIYSVHTKQEPFYPSKMQTHAIILYTMDLLKKIFATQ